MNARQVLGRLDTIKGRIESLLSEETTSRAFLAAVMGEPLRRDLSALVQRIEALLDGAKEREA